MKFSKTAGLILAIGLFAIGFIMLYRTNARQVAEQVTLTEEIAIAENLMPKLISERNDLEKQLERLESDLAQSRTRLNTAKASFRKSVDSIEYGVMLFRIAQDNNLEVVRFAASEPKSKDVGEVTYTITSIKIEVAGEMVDMVAFIEVIVNDANFAAAGIDLVDITVTEPLTKSEKEAVEAGGQVIEDSEVPVASITTDIYTY